MAIETGDLVPRASGAASLGVEQEGICGFTTDIRPFCHAHMNSGVFHSPIHGNSGVIRYSNGQMEFSDDGGINFSAFGTGGGATDLQEAHDNGNEVEVPSRPTDYGAGSRGILVSEAPGTSEFFDLTAPEGLFNSSSEVETNFVIGVSGYTTTPDDPSSYAFTSIRPEGIYIRPSGDPTAFGNETPALFIGTTSANTAAAFVNTSGFLFLNGEVGMSLTSNRTITIDSQGNADGFTSNTSVTSSFGSTILNAFATSGRLEYQFGPNEAWHTKVGAGNDTLVPIPHSGHVEQMIATSVDGRFNDQDAVTLTTSLTTNINAAATNNLVSWDTQSLIQGDSISHSTSTNSSRLVANEAGIYYISVTVSYTSTQQRYNGRVKLRVNGTTTLGIRGKSGYLRAQTGHDEASLQITNYAIRLEAGDYLEVLIDRESNVTGAVNLSANESYVTMIRGNVAAGNDLQTAYENGDTVILNSSSDLEVWAANASTFKFVGTGDNPALNISGVSRPSTTSQALGNIDLVYHGNVHSDATPTLEEAQAQSLGLATLALNTGSGIANVMVGSGIQRYRDNAGGQSIANFPTFTPITMASERFATDQYYAYDSSVTGVRVFVTGLYLINGICAFSATGATTNIFGRITVNGVAQTASVGTVPIAVNQFAGFPFQCLVNVEAGDYVQITASKLTAGATITSLASESSMNLIYLGPSRGQTT